MWRIRQLCWITPFLVVVKFVTIGRGQAGVIAFVPPNDQTGQLTSTASNDGYSTGRGIVFTMTNDVTIDQVSVRQDLSSVTLRYEISSVLAATGSLNDYKIKLREGTKTVSTTGLEWISFDMDSLDLATGNHYHIEFFHSELGNQNFAYRNLNVTFDVDSFSNIDGTQGGNAGTGSNVDLPAIRLHDQSSTAGGGVPEPTLFTILSSFGLFMLARKRPLRPTRQRLMRVTPSISE